MGFIRVFSNKCTSSFKPWERRLWMKPHLWFWLMWFFQVEEVVKGRIAGQLFLTQPCRVPKGESEQGKWFLVFFGAAVSPQKSDLIMLFHRGKSKQSPNQPYMLCNIEVKSCLAHRWFITLICFMFISFLLSLGAGAWGRQLGRGRRWRKEVGETCRAGMRARRGSEPRSQGFRLWTYTSLPMTRDQ